MRTIDEAWKSYAQECTTGESGMERELHRATFYAGAAAVYTIITKTRKAGVSAEAVAAILAGLGEEVLAQSLDPH